MEDQIQQTLLYVQGELADTWKENMLEDLEADILKYEIAGKFLVKIRKQFGGGEKEIVKVAELKILEQEERIIKKFVQEFKETARESKYKKRLLIKEFK